MSAGNVNGFPSPRTEQHKVIANMPGECRNRNLLQRLQDLVNVPVEIICHSDFKIYRVQSGVGVPGIAVGEMYCRCADIEVEPRGKYPVQVNACAEIGVYFASHYSIVGIAEIVIRLPAKRCAEPPFVVKRQAGSDSGDAGALEGVEGNGSSHFPAVAEIEIAQSYSLIGTSVYPVGGSTRWQPE